MGIKKKYTKTYIAGPGEEIFPKWGTSALVDLDDTRDPHGVQHPDVPIGAANHPLIGFIPPRPVQRSGDPGDALRDVDPRPGGSPAADTMKGVDGTRAHGPGAIITQWEA